MLTWLTLTAALAAETYPLADADLLAIRHLETEALYTALKKGGGARERYVRTATIAHAERMERLSPAMAAAEQAVEREGIDQQVPYLRRYAAEDARRRAVATGAAMAELLDDLRPGWRDESGELAELLADSVRDARRVSLTDDIAAARDEAKALSMAIQAEGGEFLTRPGTAVVLVGHFAEEGVDAFASVGLKDGARLHRNTVTVSGPAGHLEVRGIGAWVSDDEVRVTGLGRDALSLAHEGDTVVLTAPGLQARLRGALYTSSPGQLTIHIAPGVSAEAHPGVFGLFALANAADWPGHETRLRDHMVAASCDRAVTGFDLLRAGDDTALTALTAEALTLEGPPRFASRSPSPTATALPGLAAEFWRCAGLETVWEAQRPELVAAGQRAMAQVAAPLSRARAIDPARWPHVRLVPNPLHEADHATAVSSGDEVVVVFDASTPDGPRTEDVLIAATTHVAALEHAKPCPAADAAHAELADSDAVSKRGLDAHAWWVANGSRALLVQAGVLGSDRVQEWTEAGYTWVPEMVAGLERQAWDVWISDRCGWEL